MAVDAMSLGVILGGYLLGAVPFGLLLTKAAGIGDVRRIGSGNIGATNVLRTGRKGLALATLLLDGGKGAAAVLIARALTPETALLAGFAAFLGHLYPVYLGFRGGKGVATFLGVTLAAAWPVGLAACLTWLAVALLFRISSLAALVAALAGPLFAWLWAGPGMIALASVLALFILIRHRANIERLIRGEEPRIGGGSSATPPTTLD